MSALAIVSLYCFDSLGSVQLYGGFLDPYAFYDRGDRVYLYRVYERQDTWGFYSVDITDPTHPFVAGTVAVFEETVGRIEKPFAIDSFLYFLGGENGQLKLFIFALEPDPSPVRLSI